MTERDQAADDYAGVAVDEGAKPTVEMRKQSFLEGARWQELHDAEVQTQLHMLVDEAISGWLRLANTIRDALYKGSGASITRDMLEAEMTNATNLRDRAIAITGDTEAVKQ